MSELPALGAGLVSRHVLTETRDVVFVKGIVEAHEGLAQVFAEKGGELTIASPRDREAELDELVTSLAREGLLFLQP